MKINGDQQIQHSSAKVKDSIMAIPGTSHYSVHDARALFRNCKSSASCASQFHPERNSIHDTTTNLVVSKISASSARGSRALTEIRCSVSAL